MQRPRAQPAPDVISDVTVVEPRRRLPSTARQAVAADLAAAAAAVASYRFTVGPDEAFPQPPSPLVRPKNSSSGQHFVAHTKKIHIHQNTVATKRGFFCRATLCLAQPMLSCGVCPSVFSVGVLY